MYSLKLTITYQRCYQVQTTYAMASLCKQESSSSYGGEWCVQDPLMLPYEVVSHVLDYVPPGELVRVCMLVCRAWREFLTDPTFWKVRMKRMGNYTEELDSMKLVDWPRLCWHTVYQPNLIKCFDRDGRLSYDHWKWVSKDWNRFKLTVHPRSEDHQYRKYYWEIEKTIDPDRNSDLVAENSGCLSNYVTSYRWGCREQVVRLAHVGLSDKIMDKVQPAIEVSEWFCARNDCGSIFCIRVELLDATKHIIKFYEQTEVTEQWLGGELGWRKKRHVFTGYGPGVRYLRFADAGKDTQFWAGHYGSKMAGAWARVRFSSRE